MLRDRIEKRRATDRRLPPSRRAGAWDEEQERNLRLLLLDVPGRFGARATLSGPRPFPGSRSQTAGLVRNWWSATTLGGIDVDKQFTVFGAFGAVVFMLLSGLLLARFTPARSPVR